MTRRGFSRDEIPINKWLRIAIFAFPALIMLWVWFSALSFVPVPWPDDSAFYFVAKDFFKWPPRWVMIPQAPFEPTYRIFNFNTMPLYPILLGIGRFLGIDGTWGLKFWPLAAWALSGGWLGYCLLRAGLPAALSFLVTAAFMMDPVLRWASVLIRPESLIGLFGLILVLHLSLDPSRKPEEPPRHDRWWWDPISLCLALAAYSHFNAVHLLFPVVLTLATQPRRLITIGLKTALYLVPWAITVLLHLKLFIHQMTTQWTRLAVGNAWLNSVHDALNSLFQSMGSPEGWPKSLMWASGALWLLIFVALLSGLVAPLKNWIFRNPLSNETEAPIRVNLVPAAGWVLGSLWLWNSKPEVWFTYYIHAAIWTFAGLLMLRLWLDRERLRFWKPALASLSVLTLALTGLFTFENVSQASRLGATQSWHWDQYYRLVDCIDRQLVQLEKDLGSPKPFRVWDPTFPDVTVELSRRHPDWEFSRTNDFWERSQLAIQHGRQVEAVVVPETIHAAERTVDAPQGQHPEIQSAWMTWKDYFLYKLWTEPNWKPNRHLCQFGRWQAFIFMKERPTQTGAN